MFDSHAHYDDERFDADRDILLHSLFENGVTGIVNIGCSRKTSEDSVLLAEQYPLVFASVGIHPHEACRYTDGDIDVITSLLTHKKVVALGEIGLDYHYGSDVKEEQKLLFRKQMEIAEATKMPVVIHERESCADCLEIVRDYDVYGVFHSFSGSKETARLLLDRGWYISFSGTVTFKNAVTPVENASYVPEDRILVETDCPYLAPVPMRGKRNDSGIMRYTLQRLAEIRGVSFEHIEQLTETNAKRLFRIG